MANVVLKKDFANGDILYDVDLNNNFAVIEAGINANEENLQEVIDQAIEELDQQLIDITADRGWDWNGGDRVTFFKGTTSQVNSRPITNGQLLYNKETGETAMDDNNQRIQTGSGNVVVVSDTQPTNEATKDWIKPITINGTETAEEYFKNSNNQWKKIVNQPSGDTLPIGSIAQFGGATAPINWLFCNGQAVSRETYSELFAVIGTTYGQGDGSTTFNLPDYNAISPTGVEPYINQYSVIKAKQSIGVLADVTRDITDPNEDAVPNASTVKNYVDDTMEDHKTNDLLWEGNQTISGATNIDLNAGKNVYDYRFIVFDAGSGTTILVPVIQGYQYLFGTMGLISGGNQYVTNAITAYSQENGSQIRIAGFKSLTHTQNSNHNALSNLTLLRVYGIK